MLMDEELDIFEDEDSLPETPEEPEELFTEMPDLSWKGQKVRALQDVPFYRVLTSGQTPRAVGTLEEGKVFPGGIHKRVEFDYGYRYQVSNADGVRYWVTADPAFVELI